MSEVGRLQSDQLFLGLSRPPMILGVSYTYFVAIAFICLQVFIWSSNFIVIGLIAIGTWGPGYLMCMKEPRAVELALLRGKWGYRCWNRFYGQPNTYDLF